MAQDTLTYSGAKQIAEQLITYWSNRGFHGIKAEPYRINDADWGVRSNIGADGYPPHTRRGRPRTTGAGAKNGYAPNPIC